MTSSATDTHDGPDHHDHDHGHHHGHGHLHAPKDFGRAFAIGTTLNIGIVVLQTVYGLIARSAALLADAGHNLSDVLGIVIAWGAAGLPKRPATARYTCGLRGSSIIAALFNAVFLLVVLGGIAWEAIRHFTEPVAVHGNIVMAVAGAGIIISGISAWLFASGRKGDINVRGAYMHMLSDALAALGVVCAGALIVFTGWAWLDPAVTLVIVVIIIRGTWGLLRGSLSKAMAAVPSGIEPKEVRQLLSTLPSISRIHDLHIWPMSTTETAHTCHLVVPTGHPGDEFTLRVAHELRDRFKIRHATLQIETNEETDCALTTDHAT